MAQRLTRDVECPHCNGDGMVHEETPSGEVVDLFCGTCQGTGSVDEDDL